MLLQNIGHYKKIRYGYLLALVNSEGRKKKNQKNVGSVVKSDVENYSTIRVNCVIISLHLFLNSVSSSLVFSNDPALAANTPKRSRGARSIVKLRK